MIAVREIANTVTQVANPNINILWQRSTGYTTDSAGHRLPTNAVRTVPAQVQGVTASDLRHLDGLGIQGVMRSVLIFGNLQGAVRVDQKGGDILKFPEEPGGPVRSWLVSQVLETWPTWCRVIAVLQS